MSPEPKSVAALCWHIQVDRGLLDYDAPVATYWPEFGQSGKSKTMRPGAVLVDIAIDQGGCFETSHATTHTEPVFMVDNIIHYCVANMPGAVARTSTEALNNATLPFIIALADKGTEAALAADPHLKAGLNISDGEIRHAAVAQALEG